jgi:hypothetical protein
MAGIRLGYDVQLELVHCVETQRKISTRHSSARLANHPADIVRHPSDDGLVEAEIAAFDEFWQCQCVDTGARCTNADLVFSAVSPVTATAQIAG